MVFRHFHALLNSILDKHFSCKAKPPYATAGLALHPGGSTARQTHTRVTHDSTIEQRGSGAFFLTSTSQRLPPSPRPFPPQATEADERLEALRSRVSAEEENAFKVFLNDKKQLEAKQEAAEAAMLAMKEEHVPLQVGALSGAASACTRLASRFLLFSRLLMLDIGEGCVQPIRLAAVATHPQPCSGRSVFELCDFARGGIHEWCWPLSVHRLPRVHSVDSGHAVENQSLAPAVSMSGCTAARRAWLQEKAEEMKRELARTIKRGKAAKDAFVKKEMELEEKIGELQDLVGGSLTLQTALDAKSSELGSAAEQCQRLEEKVRSWYTQWLATFNSAQRYT